MENEQNKINPKENELFSNLKYEKPSIVIINDNKDTLDTSYKCFSVDRMCGHGDTGGCSSK